MIPKKIHYCWFGGHALPDSVKKYIESWKEKCPDYEIIEWNESNFDINTNIYVKEAYESKKWAFVTDYVRLYAMYNYGGIYMDTDVEVLKPLDVFLENQAFSGFESSKLIPTGIMGCEKGFELFKEFLDYYNERHFIKENGSLDTTTNVSTITNICLKHGFIGNNKMQNIDGFVLYPSDYFCPKDYITGKTLTTDNTYVIHHFSGSWLSEEEIKRKNIEKFFVSLFGRKVGSRLSLVVIWPFNFVCRSNKYGLVKTLKNYWKKIKLKII